MADSFEAVMSSPRSQTSALGLVSLGATPRRRRWSVPGESVNRAQGLVPIALRDGKTIQTTRTVSFQIDVNGPESSRFVSHIKIVGYDDDSKPYGMVDFQHPIVRQFFDRMIEVIAAPEHTCYDVPARSSVTGA